MTRLGLLCIITTCALLACSKLAHAHSHAKKKAKAHKAASPCKTGKRTPARDPGTFFVIVQASDAWMDTNYKPSPEGTSHAYFLDNKGLCRRLFYCELEGEGPRANVEDHEFTGGQSLGYTGLKDGKYVFTCIGEADNFREYAVTYEGSIPSATPGAQHTSDAPKRE